MLFHGSKEYLEPGTILIPGKVLGVSANGGKSDFVYCTSGIGFSMSDVEDTMDTSNTWEYAVKDASLWAGSGGWVYHVDGVIDSYDDHFDVSPGSFRIKPGAKVTRGFSVDGLDIREVVAWANAWKSTAHRDPVVS